MTRKQITDMRRLDRAIQLLKELNGKYRANTHTYISLANAKIIKAIYNDSMQS